MFMEADGLTRILIFITGFILFFALPFSVIIGIVNTFISHRMAQRGQRKSKYYWYKLIGISVIILATGLFLYDGYYKLTT